MKNTKKKSNGQSISAEPYFYGFFASWKNEGEQLVIHARHDNLFNHPEEKEQYPGILKTQEVTMSGTP
jgi:hypothetical protein